MTSLPPEVLAALIGAAGTVLAALIGGGSVLLVALHRRWIIELARSVEAYHRMETEWVKQSIAQNRGTNGPKRSYTEQASDVQIRARRGQLRKALLGEDHPRVILSAREAKRIRARYFDYD